MIDRWNWMHRFLAILAMIFLLPAAAAAQNMVEGTLRLDERLVPLTHVYARETRPPPTRDEGPNIIILMTDRPAPPRVIATSQAFYRAAEAGTIGGVLLMLEGRDARPRVVIAAPGGGRSDTILPDSFERLALRDFARVGGTASGHIVSAEPSYLDGGAPGTPDRASVDLSFRTVIAPAPQPSRVT